MHLKYCDAALLRKILAKHVACNCPKTWASLLRKNLQLRYQASRLALYIAQVSCPLVTDFTQGEICAPVTNSFITRDLSTNENSVFNVYASVPIVKLALI